MNYLKDNEKTYYPIEIIEMVLSPTNPIFPSPYLEPISPKEIKN